MIRLLVIGAFVAVLGLVAMVGRDAWIARKLAYLGGADPALVKCPGAEPASEWIRPRIYIVGDSTAQAWPWEGFDRRYEALGCAIAGETTAQLEQRFDRFDFLHPGDVVVLAAGIYDAVGASFAPPERLSDYAAKAADRLWRLAQAARENGGRVIVATVLPPFEPEVLRLPFWKEGIRDFTEQANADLRAKDWGRGIELLDIARTLGGDDRRTPKVWGRNGIKLNGQGYAVLTAEVNRRLAEAPKLEGEAQRRDSAGPDPRPVR